MAVKEQGSQTAQNAAQSGREVAQAAADQGLRLVSETGHQAHNVMDQAQAQLMAQASAQQHRAAGGLRGLGEQLRAAAEAAGDGGRQGPADDLLRQASDRISRVADWLDQREPGQVLDEVRAFARRRPGAFLSGATAAGVLIGRLTRGMTGGHHHDGQPAMGDGQRMAGGQQGGRPGEGDGRAMASGDGASRSGSAGAQDPARGDERSGWVVGDSGWVASEPGWGGSNAPSREAT